MSCHDAFQTIRISPAISTPKSHQSDKRQKGNLGSFFGENNGAFKKLMILNTYRFHLIMSNIKHIFRKQIGQEQRPPLFLEHFSFLAAWFEFGSLKLFNQTISSTNQRDNFP